MSNYSSIDKSNDTENQTFNWYFNFYNFYQINYSKKISDSKVFFASLLLIEFSKFFNSNWSFSKSFKRLTFISISCFKIYSSEIKFFKLSFNTLELLGLTFFSISFSNFFSTVFHLSKFIKALIISLHSVFYLNNNEFYSLKFDIVNYSFYLINFISRNNLSTVPSLSYNTLLLCFYNFKAPSYFY